MKHYLLFILVFWNCLTFGLSAQVSHGGSPLPFGQLRSGSTFGFEDMPEFDLQEQLRIDSMEYGGLRASNRFAYKFITDFTPNNSGEWFTLADGTRVWRLGIRSRGAISLNLLFTEYELPKGAQLFLYNPSQAQVRGAFTHQNNSEKHLLPVAPVYGDEIVIEYQEPAQASFHARLRIGEVNHAYRDFMRRAEPGSEPLYGSCIPLLICSIPDGDPYEHIGQSVVLLIINGQYTCTGTLLNNTSQDGQPFLLTASHCLNEEFTLQNPDYEEIAGTVISFFNYNSPTCLSPMRGTEEMSLASAYARAVNEDMDLALLELMETPPVYYRPYYAGWNASQSTDDTLYVCIQHPMGSTKRFSLAEKVEIGSFVADIKSFTKNAFWHIPEWQLGCTAIGSSGSPLFDADHRVMGTLTGGNSYCNAPYNDFYYGLFAAWQPSDEADKQLQCWLSPDNPDLKQCDGMDPYAGASALRLSHVIENGKQDYIETALLTENSYLFGLNETGTTEYAEKYALLSPAELYGCYLVTPAYSGRTDPQVDIRVYSGEDKPETLLAQKAFRPVYQSWEDGGAIDQTKPLYRSQEHFIVFDEPVRVQGNLFISYKITGENSDRFCVYNVSKGELSGNTAWLNDPEKGWIAASQRADNGFSTALYIDPVLAYTDNVTGNEAITASVPVRFVTESATHTLHLWLEATLSATYQLYDMTGRLVDSRKLTVPLTVCSYPALSSGFYIARVVCQGHEYTCKVYW